MSGRFGLVRGRGESGHELRDRHAQIDLARRSRLMRCAQCQPCGGPLDTPLISRRRVGDGRAGLSITIGMTGIGADVRCHLLDDRRMIAHERGMRSVVDEARKLAGNRIARKQDPGFERLDLKAALTLALVVALRLAVPTQDKQPALEPLPPSHAAIVADQHSFKGLPP